MTEKNKIIKTIIVGKDILKIPEEYRDQTKYYLRVIHSGNTKDNVLMNGDVVQIIKKN